MDFLHGSVGKESAYSVGDLVWSLGWEDPLEEEMATHSSIVAWRISWTEGLGGLQSMGSQRVRHDWATKHSTAQHSKYIEGFPAGSVINIPPAKQEKWFWSLDQKDPLEKEVATHSSVLALTEEPGGQHRELDTT